jgi:hypothetical protein
MKGRGDFCQLATFAFAFDYGVTDRVLCVKPFATFASCLTAHSKNVGLPVERVVPDAWLDVQAIGI